MKYKGTIKKYFPDKGFGFINNYEQGDIFFHVNNAKGTVEEKMEVEFNIRQGRKGKEAKDIKILSPYFLPNDTFVCFTQESIDNFYLKLNKAPRFYYINKEKFGLPANFNFSKCDFISINDRHRININNLGLEMKKYKFEPQDRLILGLGQASVYDASIRLHYIYGFPYIPASSIKGAIRNWIIINEFDGKEGNKKEGALSDKGFCRMFGSPKDSILGETQGEVGFFDAYPYTAPKIVTDIMTPHYEPYYSDSEGKKMPADYHNPVPIKFLAVEDTRFDIYLGINKYKNVCINDGKFKGKKPLDVIFYWLQNTLSDNGIGAKTSLGYGVCELN